MQAASLKSIESQLSSYTKLFTGKETDDNWEPREHAIKQLRDLLKQHATDDQSKAIIARRIQSCVDGIAASVTSLRTALALEALQLVADIGTHIGKHLDAYTAETLFFHALKCAGSTKKLVASQSLKATVTFLSTTAYRHKSTQTLCQLLLNDKNPQIRHHAATYLKTILETHCRNPALLGKSAGANGLDLVEKFLSERGLADAAPSVRQVSKQILSLFEEHWPERASRISGNLDSTTQRRLTRSSSSFQVTKKHRSSNASSPLSSPAASPHRSVPPRQSNVAEKRPPLPSVSSSETTTSTSRRESKITFTPLLYLLRSTSVDLKCQGIRRLIDKLKEPSSDTDDVPSAADLLPIFSNYLDRHHQQQQRWDEADVLRLHETLMSWDCLATIFVRLFQLRYYVPSLLFSSHQCQQHSPIARVHAKGLGRLKLLLRRKDPGLPGRLLELLQQQMKQPQEVIIVGLLEWMDEMVREQVGLGEEEGDAEIMAGGGKEWLENDTKEEEEEENWFQDEKHVKEYLETTLSLLEKTSGDSAVYVPLVALVGRLRMLSERLFDAVAGDHPQAKAKLKACVTMISATESDNDDEAEANDLDNSIGSIRLSDENDEVIVESSASDDKLSGSDVIVSSRLCSTENNVSEPRQQQHQIVDTRKRKGDAESDIVLVQESKRSRKGDPIQGLRECIRLLREGERGEKIGVFEELSRLISAGNPTLCNGDLFLSLIEALMAFLLPSSSSRKEEPLVEAHLNAISLLKQLLINQAGLFNEFAIAKLNVEPTTSLTYMLAETLLIARDQRQELAVSAWDAFEILICTVSADESARVLWYLISDRLQLPRHQDNIRQRHPLGELFGQLSKVISKTSRSTLQELLNDRGVDILLQGFNHSETTVRKSCVQTLVEIHSILGDKFLSQDMASLLRPDQLDLVRYYIKSKSTNN